MWIAPPAVTLETVIRRLAAAGWRVRQSGREKRDGLWTDFVVVTHGNDKQATD